MNVHTVLKVVEADGGRDGDGEGDGEDNIDHP